MHRVDLEVDGRLAVGRDPRCEPTLPDLDAEQFHLRVGVHHQACTLRQHRDGTVSEKLPLEQPDRDDRDRHDRHDRRRAEGDANRAAAHRALTLWMPAPGSIVPSTLANSCRDN